MDAVHSEKADRHIASVYPRMRKSLLTGTQDLSSQIFTSGYRLGLESVYRLVSCTHKTCVAIGLVATSCLGDVCIKMQLNRSFGDNPP